MNISRILLILLIAVLSYLGYNVNKNTHSIDLPKQEVLEYSIQHLSQEGTLMRNSDGFVYLKVDDGYIHSLYPLLNVKREGYREVPYFRGENSPGAHISVFYADEHVNPKEIGEHFHFTPKSVTIVRAGKAKYVILQVESPELEKLRQKYGMTPKLHSHEFHIAIAKK